RRCEGSWLFYWLGQRLERDLAGKPGPTFPDRARKTWNTKGATGAQKGSPAKGTGHTLLVAAQYSQKSPENNEKPRIMK
ncbi:MAG TPA: hypothetical protein VF957_05305, partial [Bradyrhizobium sp.]